MKISTVLKTNIFISLVMALGFTFLTITYYHTYYNSALKNFERDVYENVSILNETISDFFLQPIAISKAMARDTFLIRHLSSYDASAKEEFERTLTEYMKGYDGICRHGRTFLTTIENAHLYTSDGMIAEVAKDNVRHAWYARSLQNTKDYDLNIDIDKTPSAENAIALFVNHKIFDASGNVVGITGVNVALKDVQKQILQQEMANGYRAYIIDKDGRIQLSSDLTALSEVNLFEFFGNTELEHYVSNTYVRWKATGERRYVYNNEESNCTIAIKYIPDLDYYLVVERYSGDFYEKLQDGILQSALVIFSVMVLIVLFISRIISRFEKKIKLVVNDRLRYFHDATRCMYFSIYEINVTMDQFSPDSKFRQFKLNTMVPEGSNLSYSESLNLATKNVIQEGYRAGFLETFSRENILQTFLQGKENLTFDCPVLYEREYQWMHFNAHVFSIGQDNTVYMYLYVKNVNKEKVDQEKSQIDAMTQCLRRGATEQRVQELLAEQPEEKFAFFIIDIDNFKHANDTFGHAFGDLCIKTFAKTLKSVFRKSDIIGRLGGDEFVIFIPFASQTWLEEKSKVLVSSLRQNCHEEKCCLYLSGSIGVSIYPRDGKTFDALYRTADIALYEAKKAGKNTFRFYDAAFGAPSHTE